LSEIKKPGVRDISELKSKLGLKKPTAAPAAPPGASTGAAATVPGARAPAPDPAAASEPTVGDRETGPVGIPPLDATSSAPSSAPAPPASPFGASPFDSGQAKSVAPAAYAPTMSIPASANPFGSTTALPPTPGVPAPLAMPPGGASIFPSQPARSAQPEAPKVIPGTNILTSDGIFGGRRFVADTEHIDQRLEAIQARQKPKASKLALALAVLSGGAAMVGGVWWGSTAFGRAFEHTRRIEMEALKSDVDRTVNKIIEVDAALNKTTDMASRIAFSKWIGENFHEDDLIKGDKMAGKQIAFMKGSTAALMMQYVRFSREFFLDVIRFAKKNYNAEEMLLTLEKGPGPPKSYGVLITPEEAFFTSTIVTIVERKKLTAKDISVPEAEGDFPNTDFKDGDEACRVTADPEQPPQWFNCSAILPMPDSPLIPKEDMALLEEHNQQLAHVKLDLKALKEMGAKLQAALDEEIARKPDL
jgi:hypothetical protein